MGLMHSLLQKLFYALHEGYSKNTRLQLDRANLTSPCLKALPSSEPEPSTQVVRLDVYIEIWQLQQVQYDEQLLIAFITIRS